MFDSITMLQIVQPLTIVRQKKWQYKYA